MTNPGSLDDLFAAVMLVIAAYAAGRLVASAVWSRPTHRDVDVAHVLMGLSMAGQLNTGLNPVPDGAWVAVFSALALWFLGRCYQFVNHPGGDTLYDDHVHRLSRRIVHLVMALAMVYMYLAATPARIGSGMAMGTASGATADFVLLPTIFILVLLASSIWEIDGIRRFTPAGGQGLAIRRPVAVEVGAGAAPTETATTATATTATATMVNPPWLAPRLESASHIVMTVTMAYMLVLML